MFIKKKKFIIYIIFLGKIRKKINKLRLYIIILNFNIEYLGIS